MEGYEYTWSDALGELQQRVPGAVVLFSRVPGSPQQKLLTVLDLIDPEGNIDRVHPLTVFVALYENLPEGRDLDNLVPLASSAPRPRSPNRERPTVATTQPVPRSRAVPHVVSAPIYRSETPRATAAPSEQRLYTRAHAPSQVPIQQRQPVTCDPDQSDLDEYGEPTSLCRRSVKRPLAGAISPTARMASPTGVSPERKRVRATEPARELYELVEVARGMCLAGARNTPQVREAFMLLRPDDDPDDYSPREICNIITSAYAEMTGAAPMEEPLAPASPYAQTSPYAPSPYAHMSPYGSYARAPQRTSPLQDTGRQTPLPVFAVGTPSPARMSPSGSGLSPRRSASPARAISPLRSPYLSDERFSVSDDEADEEVDFDPSAFDLGA